MGIDTFGKTPFNSRYPKINGIQCGYFKSMWNTAVGIKNCTAEMMSVLSVAIFWVVNASSGEKSCLQFSIPTRPGTGGEGGVSHRLNGNEWENLPRVAAVYFAELYI